MKAFVDRISEGIATVLLGDEACITVHLPVAWLPAGTREGMVLHFEIRIDVDATEAQCARIQSLMKSMENEP